MIHNRKAIAMIELIFSIVIMGIVLMSAPMLISTSTKSAYVGLQQESIATAASQIGMILTRHWDEGNTGTGTAPVLTTNGHLELNTNGTTGRRAGTPLLSSERGFFLSSGGTLAASDVANFTTENDLDDIDDFHGQVSTLTVYNSEEAETTTGNYIDKDISIQTTVSYISDTPTSGSYLGTSATVTLDDPFNNAAVGTSSIKLINVSLTSTNTAVELNSKNIILNAFSCNIGTYDLNERSL